MRVSLTARYVTHPNIDFGGSRPRRQKLRMGLGRGETVFHRRRAALRAVPCVAALRPATAGFSFPSVGRLGRMRDRRATHSLGSPRARRA